MKTLKMIKVINYILAIMMISLIVLSNYAYAATPGRTGLKDIEEPDMDLRKAENFANQSAIIDPGDTQGVFQTISNLLLYGAIAIGVIWGAVIGVRFIIGTVETKATVKDQLVPYFIGLVVSFGAYAIWSAVVNALR